jgi:hypothetical protein
MTGCLGGFLVVSPGEDIQDLLDQVPPGSNILVLGTHKENITITKDGITLQGQMERPSTGM